MRVAHTMHELIRLASRRMRENMRQQRITRDIERDSQAHIAAALVEAAAQPAFPPGFGSLAHIELRKHVAGWQDHQWQVGGVPRADNDAPVPGVLGDLSDGLGELVGAGTGVRDGVSGGVGRARDAAVGRSKVPPLEPVHGAEVARRPRVKAEGVEIRARTVGVPDLDAGCGKGEGGGTAGDEPEELGDHGTVEDAFGGEEREGVVAEGEAEGGRREKGDGAGAGAGDLLVDVNREGREIRVPVGANVAFIEDAGD